MNALTPFLAPAQKDPTALVWPPTLPIEIALKTAPLADIQREYGYSDEQWAALPKNPAFVADLTQAMELVKQEGMSFKLKARLIAEESLKQAWMMIHDKTGKTPPSVQSDLIKAVARWAGYDAKDAAASGANAAPTFNVQINLSDRY